MKKCPYCAEDIKDEASKCKHCGEWLTVSQDRNRISDEKETAQREVRKEELNIELNKAVNAPQKNLKTETHEIMDNEDVSKYSNIPDAKKSINKPGKYGWGWIIFFGWWVTYNRMNPDPFSDLDMSMLRDILPLLFLILYFGLRRQFISKWEYPRWKPGLVAGICIFIVANIVLGAMVIFDTKSINSKITSVAIRYKGKADFFEQERGKFQAKIINEPQTTTDIKQNIKTIDEILEHENTKQKFYDNMFNDYKTALKDKINTKIKKPWGEVIDHIKSQREKTYLKQKTSFELLRDYYLTGNEKAYQEYTAIYQETEQLRNEYQKLFKEAF